MNTTAPALTTSDTILATRVCCASVGVRVAGTPCRRCGVNRFAAAIDMIAAGTSAPIAIAANATPRNHDGKYLSNSTGTTEFAFSPGLMPAAIAM